MLHKAICNNKIIYVLIIRYICIFYCWCIVYSNVHIFSVNLKSKSREYLSKYLLFIIEHFQYFWRSNLSWLFIYLNLTWVYHRTLLFSEGGHWEVESRVTRYISCFVRDKIFLNELSLVVNVDICGMLVTETCHFLLNINPNFNLHFNTVLKSVC